MLERFKKFGLKRIASIAVVVLIIIGLIPWVLGGYSGMFSRDNDTHWIKVGSKFTPASLLIADFNNFLQTNYAMVQQNPLAVFNFLNNIINQNIVMLLFANEAESIGLAVPESLIMENLATSPDFQNEDGTFNRAKFRERVIDIFESEEAFLDSVRNALLKEQLLSALYGVLTIPDYITYLEFAALQQVRDVSYVEFDPSGFSIRESAEDEELIAIRDQEPSQFTQPELRSGEIVSLNTLEHLENLTVSTSEVLDYYETNEHQYMRDEQRIVHHVLADDKEQIQELTAELKDLSPQDALAQLNFIELGEVTRQDLPDDIAEPIFRLPVNVFSEPVQSSLGWHIFYVTDILEAHPDLLENVEDEIEQILISEKYREHLDSLRRQFAQSLTDNYNNLSALASSLQAQYVQFEDIDTSSDTNYDSVVGETILSTTLDSISQINTDQDGNFYIVKINDIKPERLLQLSEIRDTLEILWQQQKITELIESRSNQLIQDIVNGGTFNSFGYSAKLIAINRLEADDTFDSAALNGLFLIVPNSPVRGRLANGNVFVGLVTNVTNYSTSFANFDPQEGDQEVIQYVENNYVQTFISTFMDKLRGKFDINVNQEAITQTFFAN